MAENTGNNNSPAADTVSAMVKSAGASKTGKAFLGRALKNSHFFAGAFSFQHINSTYIQKCSKTYKKMPLY